MSIDAPESGTDTARPGRGSRSTPSPAPPPARGSLTSSLVLPAAAGATTWWAMLSWSGFTMRPSDFLVPLAGVVAVVVGAGAAMRWGRVPGLLVLATQLVLAGVATSLVLTGQPVPGPALQAAVEQAIQASTQYAAPVPADPASSIRALLLVGGVAAALLVDLLACSLRRVPLAGLPLLVVYSVPVSILGSGPAWWVFAGSAAGFLLMLYLQEQVQVQRWGRALDEGGPRPTQRDGRRRTAVGVGVAATVAAVLVPLAVPTLGVSLLDLGSGGDGDSQIEIVNPTTDLRRNLTRNEDLPLVQVRTDDPDPSYLRISVLNRFSDNTWSSGDRAVPTDQVADGGRLPALTGVAPDVTSTSWDYEVSVTDAFASRWLPTQAPISAIEADGDWRYDESTMDFIAGQDGLSTAGLDYAMTAVDLDYAPRALDNAAQTYPQIDDELLALPEDLPAVVSDLADEVTAQADTPYERAAALQTWFRRDGGFRYSLDSVPSQVGVDELAVFLDERVGYCQQFAASMAVMARSLGIPARVAVGFLEPEQIGDDTWEYSSFDLHSWPELYFPGSGWVRFDPTPAARVGSVPAYSRGLDREGTQPTPVPSEATPSPTTRPSAAPPTAPPVVPDRVDDAAGADGGGSGVPWTTLVVLALVLAALVALARTPRALRERQRAARSARGGPEDAWRELRATALDLGVRWPEGRSPRETAAALTAHFAAPVAPGDGQDQGGVAARPARGPGRNPEADAALARIVAALERSRYARSSDAGHLADETTTCREALLAGAGPRARRRAAWLPVSLLRDRAGADRSGAGDPPAPESADRDLTTSR